MVAGAANTNPAMSLSPAQIASLPQGQQQQYLQRMSPEQQAMVAQAAQQARIASNRAFMRQSVERKAYCPVAGGSGTSAAYTQGTTLVFDLPVVGSGYAKGLLINYSLTVTLAAGAAAVYGATPAAPYSLFSELLLNYNGAQIRTHPYILKLLSITKGYSRGAQNTVVAGTNNATISTNISGGAAAGFNIPPTATGANTWQGKIYLPFNALGEDSVPGCLPVMGVGNKPQLKLTCAPNFIGATGGNADTANYGDPLLNSVYPISGTGHALTSITGNINVDMIYLDGTTMSDPGGLVLDVSQEPTLQFYWDTPLNPLTSGTLNRQHIATLLEHWMVYSIVIDGLSAAAFTTLANLTAFQLSADSVGQQNFESVNVSNNISVYDWYWERRRDYGQDLDVGVIPWVDAPVRNVVDTDNRNGAQVLNMNAGGFPAATHAYQMTSVGNVLGATPRVETFLISMNYNGLRIG